jgi:diguanylate cyclase (GGDEF)-like protein
MDAWDLSASLVRLVILLGAMVGLPFLRRWVGGPLKAYLVAFGGLLFVSMAEAVQFWQLVVQTDYRPPGIAWDTLCTLSTGYVAILLGLLMWIRDLRRIRDELQRSNLTLQEAAATDFLTGLLSRRQASFLLDFETARARRSGRPLGFIMIDLDLFKQVNDTYGHLAGDAVLVHVGQLLKSRLRASDIVCRYGGEEFLVLLPDATYENTTDLANSLRKLLEESPTRYGDNEITIRASFGVAVSHIDGGVTAQDAITRADAALYAAKALGRNRVVSWEEIAPRTAAATVGKN